MVTKLNYGLARIIVFECSIHSFPIKNKTVPFRYSVTCSHPYTPGAYTLLSEMHSQTTPL